MAREVNATLGKIIATERGLTEAQGEEIVKKLRNNNLYQVCLFGSFFFEKAHPVAAAEMTSSHTRYLLSPRCTMKD